MGARGSRAAAVVVALSVALLLLTAPVMLLAALAIKLTSPGPVLYMQTRVGQHGRHFRIVKFRSMRHDAEAVALEHLESRSLIDRHCRSVSRRSTAQ